MGTHRRLAPLRRAEARLRTGAAAHLLGGGLDLLGAIATHLLQRVRGRTPSSGSGPAGPSNRVR
jgi:hypothetical protein